MNNAFASILVAVCVVSFGFAQTTLKVRHDHDPWGSCEGDFVISDSGIEYRSENEKHSRNWPWENIQTIDRKTEREFTVLTYKDQALLLGADQPYDFKTLPDSPVLDEETFDLISSRFEKPLVDRVPEPPGTVEYEIPVKHLHTLGGCEGVLRFGTSTIVYDTENKKDAREWRKNPEVSGIWSVHQFDLQIQVHEKDQGDLYKTRNFRFQLKEPLDTEYYEKLRREFLPMR